MTGPPLRVGRPRTTDCTVTAEADGVIVIEAAGHPGAGDRDNFADDGFHASEDGHKRIAAGVVNELRRLHERVG